MNELLTAGIGLASGIVTGAAAALWGPFVKERFDRRHKAEELRDRYSPPLLQAAFDLQSRFYNIVRQRFLDYLKVGDEADRYAEHSTLWLLAQYLGWVEILRREAQFLDFGKRGKNRALQSALGNVARELATDARSRTFSVFRTTQRAIGELMITEMHDSSGATRTACLGYAEFVRRLGDPQFARWFQRLQTDLTAIDQGRDFDRLIRVQRALVDLVDELDSDRVRYPELDSRGRLPLPGGDLERSQFADCPAVARFGARAAEYDEEEDSFPWCLFDAWASRHRLHRQSSDDDLHRTYVGKQHFTSQIVVHALSSRQSDASDRIEIYAAVEPRSWLRSVRFARSAVPLSSGDWRYRRRRRAGRSVVNDLLQRLGRPSLR